MTPLTPRVLDILHRRTEMPEWKRQRLIDALRREGVDLTGVPGVDVSRTVPTRKPRVRAPRIHEPVGRKLAERIAGLVTIKAGKSCGCQSLADEMDQWGCDRCEQKREYIVGRLLENRGMLAESLTGTAHAVIKWALDTDAAAVFLRPGAEWLLTQAITDARACGTARPQVARRPHPRATRRVNQQTAEQRIERVQAVAVTEWKEGMPESTDDKRAFRLSKCVGCKLRSGETCGVTGKPFLPAIKARDAACPVGKWSSQRAEYRPLIQPTRNLIFHVYPLLGAEWNWHWHFDKIAENAEKFNGVISIAIVTGPGLASPEIVKNRLSGVPVNHWIIEPNEKRLGETVTFTRLLETVETTDPNSITFRGHCKGVTHRRNGIEAPWANLMWDACMDIESAEDALASHVFAGPMKCHEPLVSKQRYRWFFAGTFFWFRNADVFSRDWREMEQTRWFPEAWPGVIASNEESACLLHDFTDGSVLRPTYWHGVVVPSWDQWRAAR